MDPKPAIRNRNSPSLSDSIIKIRENQVERNDVVVEMQQAARARLEMLAEDLEPVFRDVPKDIELFEFGISGGTEARLWIDLTSFVRMGRDRRGYEFVKDTRHGRTLIGATPDRRAMAEMVTNYIAERLIDRDYIIEGDWQARRLRQSSEQAHDWPLPRRDAVRQIELRPDFGFRPLRTDTRRNLWLTLLYSVVLFATGFLIGAATLILWAWFAGVSG